MGRIDKYFVLCFQRSPRTRGLALRLLFTLLLLLFDAHFHVRRAIEPGVLFGVGSSFVVARVLASPLDAFLFLFSLEGVSAWIFIAVALVAVLFGDGEELAIKNSFIFAPFLSLE